MQVNNSVKITLFCLIVTCVLLTLQPCQAGEKFTVYTVNYPLTYFAKRIGGSHIDVEFPAPPEVDPAFWTPDRATLKQYQQADLILLNGAGYEKWVETVSLPLLRTVTTSRAFNDALIRVETSVTHSHGPTGDHSHGGNAFTTWLDFSQAGQQAETIYKALVRKVPAHKGDFKKNFLLLQENLRGLDQQMVALGEQLAGQPLIGSHPIYQYLARRYKLNLQMVMWEPDEYPADGGWQALRNLRQNHPATTFIWEAEPLQRSKEKLVELQLHSIVFSPCFSVPEEGDFLSVMQHNINNLKRVLH